MRVENKKEQLKYNDRKGDYIQIAKKCNNGTKRPTDKIQTASDRKNTTILKIYIVIYETLKVMFMTRNFETSNISNRSYCSR